jgi:hypothetical protein
LRSSLYDGEGGGQIPVAMISLGQMVISFNTSGRKSAILINVFAARDGSRRPCSHCSSVRFDTPINAANWLWERPVFMRALATSVFG